MHATEDVYANNDIDVGSDHRSVELVVRMDTGGKTRRKKRNTNKGKAMVGWRPEDTELYKAKTVVGLDGFSDVLAAG